MATNAAVPAQDVARRHLSLSTLVRRSADLTERFQRAWPVPLNGQRFRQELIRSLARELEPGCVFESGTYRGATTHFLHHVTGKPVYSAEKNKKYARAAAKRLHDFPDIRVINRDSRSTLRMLRDSAVLPTSHVLFYLDAHWEDDLPLRDEVQIITKTWQSSIIVIDDFKVPDDHGYGFDTYGQVQLSMEYLGKESLGYYRAFWPSLPSTQESGHRRGCVVLASPDLTTTLSGMSELRTIPELSQV